MEEACNFILAVFPESTSHVKVSCIYQFWSGITEWEQIEHSPWGNINITSKNPISFIKKTYIANWQRHQSSPRTLLFLLKPHAELWHKDAIKSQPVRLRFCHLLYFPLCDYSIHWVSYGMGHFFFEAAKKRPYYKPLLLKYSTAHWLSVESWWWSKVKCSMRLSIPSPGLVL